MGNGRNLIILMRKMQADEAKIAFSALFACKNGGNPL
jgi:hypothetical protein